MSKEYVLSWVKGIRPFTFTGSVIPVVLGAFFAAGTATLQIGYFVLSVLAIVSLQAGANLLNDYDDYTNKVDTVDSQLSSGVIVHNRLTAKEVLLGGKILLALGALTGVFLSVEKGVFILIIGVAGTLGAYFYTGKPLTLKYRGLGAPLVFLLFGPFMFIGSYYVQTQRIGIAPFLVSIPVGLLTTAILHANDIRDICQDSKAGIKTLSILVGEAGAHAIYIALLVTAYLSVVLMVVFGVLPYLCLACFVTAPDAVKCIRKLRSKNRGEAGLATFDKDTAQLDAKFGILLILAVLVWNIIL